MVEWGVMGAMFLSLLGGLFIGFVLTINSKKFTNLELEIKRLQILNKELVERASEKGDEHAN